MPPIGLLLGNVDFSNLFLIIKGGKSGSPYSSSAAGKGFRSSLGHIGIFINTIISFLIVAFSVFLVIKNVNRMKKEPPLPDPATKDCPFCYFSNSY